MVDDNENKDLVLYVSRKTFHFLSKFNTTKYELEDITFDHYVNGIQYKCMIKKIE